MASFVPRSVDDDKELFDLLRQASLDCDKKAPIYINRSDIAYWEATRNDLKECIINSNRSRQAFIIRKLSDLLLSERKQEYFKEAATLRAEGKPTNNLAKPHQNPKRISIYAAKASFLTEFIASIIKTIDESAADQGRALYIERLISYQSMTGPRRLNRKSPLGPTALRRRCLLCQALLKDMDNLNGHYRDIHWADFSKPFACPECSDNTQVIND